MSKQIQSVADRAHNSYCRFWDARVCEPGFEFAMGQHVANGRTRKEAARRAAVKLRKLAAEFDKIAEGEK